MAFVANLNDFLSGLQKERETVTRMFRATVVHTIVLLHEEITGRTPVHTGYTIVNYIWSMDNPIEMTREAIDNGDPGHTNDMPLGPEPRRGENLDVATATLKNLEFENPYRRFWLTNTSTAIEGLEYGELPPSPLRQRSPQGMFEVSLNYVYNLLEAGMI